MSSNHAIGPIIPRRFEPLPGQPLLEEIPELKPCVRVSATYPATDGSMPETVEVTWETEFPDDEMIQGIIETMCRIPMTRVRVYGEDHLLQARQHHVHGATGGTCDGEGS